MSEPAVLTGVSAVELHAQTQLDRITAPVTQVTMETVKEIVHIY